MSNVFVINQLSLDPLTTPAKQPRVGWEFVSSALNASHNNADVNFLKDGMDTIKWRPGVLVSEVEGTGFFHDLDFVAVSGVNWQSAGLTLRVTVAGGTVEVANVNGLRDNQPLFIVFDTQLNISDIKFEFTCNFNQLEVGEIYFGKSMELPRNVSVGYQPGRWTSNDDISFSRTQNNQFGRSTVTPKGTTERFTINYVPVEFMNNEYTDFINGAKGRPIFFLWDYQSNAQAILGHWTADKPTYQSAFLSAINITVDGIA